MGGWSSPIAAVAFSLSAALTVYVLVGYPALLGLISALARPRPVRREHVPRTVSVLLPVRNGERWVADKLSSLLALDYPRDLVRILVIDDGSTDRTREIVATFQGLGVELVALPRGGKAAALNAGMERATGEILFFTDVRQPLAPDSLKSLVSWFADPAIGVVSGELVIMDGQRQQEADIGFYWRYEKWIRRRLSRLHSVMGATGSIYAMRRELAAPLPPGTLVDDMHLPLAAFFKGCRIVFDEGARAYDYPTALDAEFRRKVRTLAGNYQIIRAFPRLLLPVHPMWLHFVSHKLGRLLLPFALATIAACTPLLPGPAAAAAAGAQAVVYGLALLDPLVPDGARAKRLTSPARTFVVLMVAAARAAWVAARGHPEIWTETTVAASDRLRPV
jgi:cellulose synthase/poly-beta-1,6-N-acetylglucosamine synthase-like glycosyltransferase